MLSTLLSRIWSTFRRRRLEEEFNEEVQAHLEMLAERFMARGMEPVEAFYAARRQFGGVTQVKEELRERRALPPIDVLFQDMRHAFRQLRSAKKFTASAAITLALGIGASTAMFSVLDTVVLRPLPFADPDRLMAVASIDRRGTPHPTSLSYPTFFDFRQRNRVFDHLVSYRDDRFTLNDSLPAIQVVGEIVSWDLFPLLGVQPELGRGFRREEEATGTHVAVLSDSLWRSRFGGDPGILERRIKINGKPFRVGGVTPDGFRFPVDNPEVELWTTLSEDTTVTEFTPLSNQRGARVLEAIGRLKPGVTVKQAQAQMNQIAASLAREYPKENKNVATTAVMPELQRLTGRSRKPLLILLGAVGLLLLIACANVANLLLARSTERMRELTLRTAVGASRLALARQVLIESLSLGLVGSATGVLLAMGILKTLLQLAGDSIPRIAQVSIDARVLGFSAIVTILTSLVFGAAPIFQAVRANPANALKEGAANIARGQHRFRSALIIGQIALGLVLIVGAELLISSFVSLVQRDPGFRADHLLTFEIGLPDTRSVATQITFCDRLLERLRAIPGVKAVATGNPLPLQGDQMSVSFDIEERRASAPDRPHSDMAIVTPGYFAVMGIPLKRGRDFSGRDDANAPRVLVVNEAFARKYFPGEDVIGKRIEPGATNGKEGTRLREIIGVVGNAKQVALSADPDPIYYFPYKQLSWGMGTIVLRTSVPPLTVERAARDVVTSLDREAPMYRVRTGTEISAKAIAPSRFPMVLMSSFAGAALLLTVTGLYGVLSYAVARRRREIGVRIAVGAERSQIVGLVLRQAALLVTAGMLLGMAGAIGVGRLLESMVYGFRPGVLFLVAGACCVMAVTSLVAAYLPAARAASVDPMQALRSE
ncbi:MAG TPA: ABC transporter permease [Bryobacteraceae bacterium]